MCVCVSRYVVHVLVTHTHAQIDMVNIVRVNHMLTLNVAHQTTDKSSFDAQADIEREEVGDQYTRVVSCNKTVEQRRFFEAIEETRLEPRRGRGSVP